MRAAQCCQGTSVTVHVDRGGVRVPRFTCSVSSHTVVPPPPNDTGPEPASSACSPAVRLSPTRPLARVLLFRTRLGGLHPSRQDARDDAHYPGVARQKLSGPHMEHENAETNSLGGVKSILHDGDHIRALAVQG